jgi:L-fuconolactonase
MPDFPIVDGHVHFYDPNKLSYPWLKTVPRIDGTYLPGQLDTARGQVDIEKIVFVEVDVDDAENLNEAIFVATLASTDRRIAGIVASVALERGAEAEREIERLLAIPNIKGVRRLIQYHPEPDWCLNPRFIEGVRLLEKYSLTFDICIRNFQLASAVKLVRQCPGIHFVLDHIAKPSIAAGEWEPWASDLQAMAALANVVCKISGVATEADHASWTPEIIRPYINHAVACFGWSRLMFGSDWPVVNLASSYRQWVALLDDILQETSESDRRNFYRENAIRTYRLT